MQALAAAPSTPLPRPAAVLPAASGGAASPCGVSGVNAALGVGWNGGRGECVCGSTAVLNGIIAGVSGVNAALCVGWFDCSSQRCDGSTVLNGLKAVLSDGQFMLSEC